MPCAGSDIACAASDHDANGGGQKGAAEANQSRFRLQCYGRMEQLGMLYTYARAMRCPSLVQRIRDGVLLV
eukprot:3635451-Rhodomonas_salina.7